MEHISEAHDEMECEQIQKELEELLASEKEEKDSRDVALIEKTLELVKEVCMHEKMGAEMEDKDMPDEMPEGMKVRVHISKLSPAELKAHLQDLQSEDQEGEGSEEENG